MPIVRRGLLTELAPELLRSRRGLQIEENKSTELEAKKIVELVRSGGDAALLELTARFDGVDVKEKGLKVTDSDIRQAYAQVDDSERSALEFLRDRIANIEKRRLQALNYIHSDQLIRLVQATRPIDSIGCYIPGGLAVYPSTLLMTVVPAKIAGVKRIAVFSPPRKGDVDPLTLVAADICGVNEVYRVGGAQAIAAMAYGTQSIAPVEKIIGPAGRFVTITKMLVSRDVAIDMPAGPSEVLILADEDADPELAALDIISQAEHSPDSVPILVSTSPTVLDRAEKFILHRLPELERREIVEKALQEEGALLLADSMEDALAFVNAFAPEHLQLMVREPDKIARQVSSAGIILIGENTPVAASDYALGTNHVLPTSGYARIYSGLSVLDYVRWVSIVEARKSSIRRVRPVVEALSKREGLPNHYLALQGRLKNA